MDARIKFRQRGVKKEKKEKEQRLSVNEENKKEISEYFFKYKNERKLVNKEKRMKKQQRSE